MFLEHANNNVAIGYRALYNNIGGNRNIALGTAAGFNQTGIYNIAIGNYGSCGDSFTIRIGDTNHSETFIAGIHGSSVSIDGVGVLVDSAGRLGTAISSRRFKDDVGDMGDATKPLFDLRPVIFRYKQHKETHGDDAPVEYGLIAEEVAGVFPDLVVYDDEGRPETVKYHLLGSMLLNEMQKQRRELDALGSEVSALRELLASDDR